MATEDTHSPDTGEGQPSPVPLRTLIIAFVLAVVGVRFHTSSILHGLGASPQLPLATLFALVALHPLLTRLLKLRRADVIVIYCV
ncbi:MAG: hypothetical protein PVH68_16410, partial [Armatimonadota bacterium]